MAYSADYLDTACAGEYAGAAASAGMSAREEQQHLVAYAPLVKRIVRQLNSQVSGVMAREDMEQIGLMGLLEALRRYGAPDTGFGSFATLRIRGAILDELRRQDWRPRAVRQDAHRVRDGLRALTRKLGREPTPQEAADALGMTQEAYFQHLLDDGAEEMLQLRRSAAGSPGRRRRHTRPGRSAPGAAQPGTGAVRLERARAARNRR